MVLLCSSFPFWFCISVPVMVVEDNEVELEDVRQEGVGGKEEERPRRFWVLLRRKGTTPDEKDGALWLTKRDVLRSVLQVGPREGEVEAVSVKQGEEIKEGDGTMVAG